MAQHLWHEFLRIRACEVCLRTQIFAGGEWAPDLSPICAGDDDDGGRRRTRPKPVAPSGAPRVLELA